MLAGVTVVDPSSTYVDWGVEVGPRHRDPPAELPVRPHPGRRGLGEIGPGTYLNDVFVGDRARVVSSYLHAVRHRLRTAASARSPTSAPTRCCAKAPRPARSWRSRTAPWARAARCLTSATSATPSSVSDTNIAAGNITANYDGFEKHPTTIGERRQDRGRHHLRGAGERGRRRLHGGRLGDHAGRAGRRARRRPHPTGEHRRLRKRRRERQRHETARRTRRRPRASPAGERPAGLSGRIPGRAVVRRRAAASDPLSAAHDALFDGVQITGRNRLDCEGARRGWRCHPLPSEPEASDHLRRAQQPGPGRQDRRAARRAAGRGQSSRRSPTARTTAATKRASAAATPSSCSRPAGRVR